MIRQSQSRYPGIYQINLKLPCLSSWSGQMLTACIVTPVNTKNQSFIREAARMFILLHNIISTVISHYWDSTIQGNCKFSLHIKAKLHEANKCLFIIRCLRKEGYIHREKQIISLMRLCFQKYCIRGTQRRFPPKYIFKTLFRLSRVPEFFQISRNAF